MLFGTPKHHFSQRLCMSLAQCVSGLNDTWGLTIHMSTLGRYVVHLSLINESDSQQTSYLSLGSSGEWILRQIGNQLLSNCPCLFESYMQSPRSDAASFEMGVLMGTRSTLLMASLCYFHSTTFTKSCNNTCHKTSMHHMNM